MCVFLSGARTLLGAKGIATRNNSLPPSLPLSLSPSINARRHAETSRAAGDALDDVVSTVAVTLAGLKPFASARGGLSQGKGEGIRNWGREWKGII